MKVQGRVVRNEGVKFNFHSLAFISRLSEWIFFFTESLNYILNEFFPSSSWGISRACCDKKSFVAPRKTLHFRSKNNLSPSCILDE